MPSVRIVTQLIKKKMLKNYRLNKVRVYFFLSKIVGRQIKIHRKNLLHYYCCRLLCFCVLPSSVLWPHTWLFQDGSCNLTYHSYTPIEEKQEAEAATNIGEPQAVAAVPISLTQIDCNGCWEI